MGKRRGSKYSLILFVILLTMQAMMLPLHAAGSQYGIWCPGCGKWQDHFKGTVESDSLTRTEYTDGRIQYSNGEIVVSCAECSGKLIRIMTDNDYDTYNSGTEDENQAWWKDYVVEKCGNEVVFPQMASHMEGDSYTKDSFIVTSDGNIVSADGEDRTAETIFNEAAGLIRPLFGSLADCLTLKIKNNSSSSIRSVYAVSDGEFTWKEWYDSGWKTDSNGNGASALTSYMRKFGIQASPQNCCQITFYANGGEGNMSAVTVMPGYIMLPSNSFIRSGYSFLGWSLTSAGSAVYLEGEEIFAEKDMVLYAVWEKEKEPPVLSVTGEAEIKIYRSGELISTAVNAGDRVEIIPVKKQGREYADYSISGSAADISWNDDAGKLCFTMPEENVSVSLFFFELRGLEVGLRSIFYDTYQKSPYWDGQSFNLDCEPPITVEKEMLEVTAVFYHTGTGQNVRRIQTAFSIVGDNRILSLGENAVIVEADVLQDGYVLRGQCTLQADSVSLKELMEQTGSQTYTELKEFVEGLMQKLAGYEAVIEELTDKLALSEEERQKCEAMLDEALADVERLKEELADSREQLADTLQELENMRNQLILMQDLMQELTGTTQIDASTIGLLKEKFEELKRENEVLADKLKEMEEERIVLTDKISGLENEKAGLTDKIAGLEEEKAGLTDRIAELEEEKEGIADKINSLETEHGSMASKYAALSAVNEELLREKEKLLADKEYLIRSNEELAEQLKYAIEEQRILLGDYDLLKKNYSLLLTEKEKKEQEYRDTLSSIERHLKEVRQEKEKLNEQLLALEKEKLALEEVWQKDKAEMAASIQILQAKETEYQEKVMKESIVQQETVTEAEDIQAGPVIEAEDIQEEPMREQAHIMREEPVVQEETILQTESIAEADRMKQTERNGFDILSVERRIFPGIVLVLTAMLMGGSILYLALGQKEKKVNYTCD